jgi:hypothetical protein
VQALERSRGGGFPGGRILEVVARQPYLLSFNRDRCSRASLVESHRKLEQIYTSKSAQKTQTEAKKIREVINEGGVAGGEKRQSRRGRCASTSQSHLDSQSERWHTAGW